MAKSVLNHRERKTPKSDRCNDLPRARPFKYNVLQGRRPEASMRDWARLSATAHRSSSGLYVRATDAGRWQGCWYYLHQSESSAVYRNVTPCSTCTRIQSLARGHPRSCSHKLLLFLYFDLNSSRCCFSRKPEEEKRFPAWDV